MGGARRRSRLRRPRGRRLRKLLAVVALAPLVATVLPLLALRVVPPPASAFMVERRLDGVPVSYRWVRLERISPWAAIAVVAAEDQSFPTHSGFDWDSIRDALLERRARVRGASTISQQLAKNLFLWSERSVVRKGLEAWFTLWLELLWSKQRILETYLNVAEFGNGVFGVEAASSRFFGHAAHELDPYEAALLAAALPSPTRLHVDAPSPYLQGRAAQILEQADMLGGPGYLREILAKDQR